MIDDSLLVFILIIVIVAILFVLLYLSSSLNSVKHSSTNGTQYGVLASRSGTILNLCGGGSDPCEFGMNNLQQSINKCNELNNICTAFTYNDGRMVIIDRTKSIVESSSTNLYQRGSTSVIIV